MGVFRLAFLLRKNNKHPQGFVSAAGLPRDALPSAALQQAIPGDAEEPRGEEQHLKGHSAFMAPKRKYRNCCNSRGANKNGRLPFAGTPVMLLQF